MHSECYCSHTYIHSIHITLNSMNLLFGTKFLKAHYTPEIWRMRELGRKQCKTLTLTKLLQEDVKHKHGLPWLHAY